MSHKAQRKKIMRRVGPLFIKKGKILNQEEYTALGDAQPVRGSSIKKYFGSYAAFLRECNLDEPLVALVAQSEALQKEKQKVSKPAPKAKVKPKAKPAPKIGASKAEK
tara:strand:- start:347 stop:670 length:324 start_codon:yes stop_codon:yes gene_type:complete